MSLAYGPTVLVLESTFPLSSVCMFAPHTPLYWFSWRGVQAEGCQPEFAVPCPIFGLGAWEKCMCSAGAGGEDRASGANGTAGA